MMRSCVTSIGIPLTSCVLLRNEFYAKSHTENYSVAQRYKAGEELKTIQHFKQTQNSNNNIPIKY